MRVPVRPSMSTVNRELAQSNAPLHEKVMSIELLTGGPLLGRNVTDLIIESVRTTPRPATTSLLTALADAVYTEQMRLYTESK